MSTGDSGRRPEFPRAFDAEFPVGPAEGDRAYFGRNVLRGLTDGIEDFVRVGQPRWKPFRSLGPMLLGSAGWMDDQELIDKIGELAHACIVISKKTNSRRALEKLRALNKRTPGLPMEAFAALTDLEPKVDGEPVVIGPGDTWGKGMVPTIRTIGYRGARDGVPYPPMMHAKLALLGHLVWHDEDVLGHVADIVFFQAHRLWLSSANFTYASRYSLEYGFWTEDKALLEGAERFLTTAMAHSEALDPETDAFAPEFAPVEFDDEAFRDYMAEYMADMEWEDDESF